MEKKIKDVLEKIRPVLQNDGGDVEFVAMDGNQVQVRLKGHCAGCEFSLMTVKDVIESELREKVNKDIYVVTV